VGRGLGQGWDGGPFVLSLTLPRFPADHGRLPQKRLLIGKRNMSMSSEYHHFVLCTFLLNLKPFIIVLKVFRLAFILLDIL
jgi:hypothetical protein